MERISLGSKSLLRRCREVKQEMGREPCTRASESECVCADAQAVWKWKSAHKKPKGRMAFQLEIPHVGTYSEKMPRNFHHLKTETLSSSDRFFFLFEN